MITGHNRNAGFFHQRLGAILEPHRTDRSRRRADEFKAGLHARFGKITALGQEAVTGMNAFGARLPGDLEQALDAEIAFPRFGWADEVGLVANAPVQRGRVGGRINGDRAHAHPLGGAGDAASDFAAIGNENGFEHGEKLPSCLARAQIIEREEQRRRCR